MRHLKEEPEPVIGKPLNGNDFTTLTSPWFAEYVNRPADKLFEIINAANYLEVTSLLNLCCAKVAMEMKNRTVPEIRKLFNIENDFTPEEEDQVLNENKWCEENF